MSGTTEPCAPVEPLRDSEFAEEEATFPSEGGLLSRLSVMNFRCFERLDFSFTEQVNCFVGPNAVGKTSVLEAICVLLRLQSPRVSTLGRIVRHGASGFSVQGDCAERCLQFYFGSRRKKLALDRVEQNDAGEYLKVARLVYFGNSDREIADGSGEGRRRFLDFAGMQFAQRYRLAWKRYQRALRARNALFRAPAVRKAEVEAFNGPLAEAGEEIIAFRKALIEQLSSHAPAAYSAISSGGEILSLNYLPSSEPGNLLSDLVSGFSEDLRLRTTATGPHRDDFELLIDGVNARNFASEGQQRTMVLALKLAHARLLRLHAGIAPILLMDDIFGELDPVRRRNLMKSIPPESQCFITTTTLDWAEKKPGAVWPMGLAR